MRPAAPKFGSNGGLPYFIDGTTPAVRMAGARKSVELGLEDRAIFNSIGPETKIKEIDEVKELGLKRCVVMTHNAKKPTFEGKVEIAEECLETAAKAGFSQFLMDTAVLDYMHLSAGEIGEGYRLSCQVTAVRDIEVHVPPTGDPANAVILQGGLERKVALQRAGLADMDMAEMGALFEPHIGIAGNIDHIQLLPLGTADEVREACLESIASAGGHQATHCMLAPGCEITADTPAANFGAYVQAARAS